MKNLRIEKLKRDLKFWRKLKAANQEQKEAFKKQANYCKEDITKERQKQKEIRVLYK